MRHEVIISGVGGKGVLLVAQVLARAGSSMYKYGSLLPCYRGQKRLGSIECSVVLSDEEIASPVLSEVETAMVVEPSQLPQFEDRVKSHGMIIVESADLKHHIKRPDVSVIEVPGVKIAGELGSIQCANFVLLGAYIKATKAVDAGLIEKDVKLRFDKDEKMQALNIQAFRRGLEA